MEAYLDNAATTRVLPEVAEIVRRAMLDDYGNPSSLHAKGAEAERLTREARETLAAILGCRPPEIIFTSGGTEANSLAIRGTAWTRHAEGRHIITSQVEHPSVLQTCRMLAEEGWEITYLRVDPQGAISLRELERSLRPTTVLVSIQYVNNEVGAVQPVSTIARLLREQKRRPWLHVDAVQALGKLPVQVDELGADLVSLSAHKLHGPKGVGVLYARQGLRLRPLLAGGEQEFGLRAGTENVPGIAGFGVAARLAERARPLATEQMRNLKVYLARRAVADIPGCHWNGPPPEQGAPHILNLCFPGIGGEIMVHFLEERGVYVSTTSACSSRHRTVSHVLLAMGLPEDEAACSIRLSLSRFTTQEEVSYTLEQLHLASQQLQRTR